MASHGSPESREAEPVTAAADESPAVGVPPAGAGTGGGYGKLSLPRGFAQAGTSPDPHRGPSAPRRPSPRGGAVKRRREIDAKVRREFWRRQVRARVVAEVAAAEHPKQVRAESLPASANRALVLVRVHGNGRREARPGARQSGRRASNSAGDSSGLSDSGGSDGEPEPRGPGSGLLGTPPTLAFTAPRAALACAVARWEAAGGVSEVREAPFGLWWIRRAHTRRLERLGWLVEPAERGRSGRRRWARGGRSS